jgi:hypothetical protein
MVKGEYDRSRWGKYVRRLRLVATTSGSFGEEQPAVVLPVQPEDKTLMTDGRG